MDNYKQKISHLKALYHLATADNVLTKVEAVYIKNVAERLGVSAEELLKFDNDEPALDCPIVNIRSMPSFIASRSL